MSEKEIVELFFYVPMVFFGLAGGACLLYVISDIYETFNDDDDKNDHSKH
jgi:hypothetical protein